ncbi:MAG: rhodanese-like domain-containing protein [Chloroflexota bacterium]
MPTKANRQTGFPVLMMTAGVLLIIVSAWFFISAALPQATSTPTAMQARIPYPEVRRVNLPDAKAAYELGTAVFVDTRGDAYFDQEHIPGALSISAEEVPGRLSQLKPTDWIITYCT